MKVTLNPENQPAFRASIKPIPGANLDEVTLEPLTPEHPIYVFQVDTRGFARMGMGHPYTVLPKNLPKGFFQVTRISWDHFVFDWHPQREGQPPFLLEKIIVCFSFPKTRSYT